MTGSVPNIHNEKYYKLLADNVSDLVAIYATDGTIRYISSSVFTLLGYHPEKFIGIKPDAFIHPDDKHLMVQFPINIDDYSDNNIVYYRLLHISGRWIDFESQRKLLRGPDGNVEGVLAICRDISFKKQVELKLRESEEKYRSLVESSDAMIAIIDEQFRFVFVNDKRAAFFKLPKENILGKTAYEFYDDATALDFNNHLQKVFNDKQNHTYEALTKLYGKPYWLKVNMTPVLNSEGNVSAVMVNTNDITNAKQTEDALRHQNDELKQIAFLQSHIVRSPLTNIQGIIALIEEEELAGEHRFYMGLLKQATDKLDSVIKEIVERAVVIRHNTKDI